MSSIANKTAGGSLDVPTLVPFDASRRPDIQAASPYKGLDPFTQEDADNFFGREDAAAELQKRLESDLPIVLLIGPSGSGKSSLIHAGLLPRLERSETLAGYKCLPVVYPGQAPLAAILKAIEPGSTTLPDVGKIVRSPQTLNNVLSAAHSKAILIIDQFGEAMSRDDVYPGVNVLGEALKSLIGTHKLLICIRESQRAQFEQVAGIGEYIKSPANCFSPPPPSVYELRSVIEGPAERVGLRFGEGVVEELVRSVAGNPDALPLLQFTLSKLWDYKERNEVTQESYRKVGTPREALTGTADAVLRKFSTADQDVVKRIFLKLVTPAGDKDFVRNRISREMLAYGANAPTIDSILRAFEDEKLLRRFASPESRQQDRFEVAHETLIAYWPQLSAWLAGARQGREMEAKLLSTARLWLDSGRDPGYLITGEALEQLRNFQTDLLDVRQLIDASIKAETARLEARAKEEEESRRRKRKWKRIAMIVAAAAVIGMVFASMQGRVAFLEAQREAESSVSSVLGAKLDSANTRLAVIRTAVIAGDQETLRRGLKALGISDAAADRVTTSPPPGRSQTVNDTLAQASTPPSVSPSPAPLPVPDAPPPPQPQFDPRTGKCIGFMWLGSQTNWKLAPDLLTNFERRPLPLTAKIDTQTSIALRADFPTSAYAMAPPFGSVFRDTTIDILEIKPYERNSVNQYWAKVHVPRKVCARVHIQYTGSDEQAAELRRLLTAAEFQMPFVPEKIEQASGRSEIRYFFKEDVDLAKAVAEKVKQVNGGKDVKLVPLLNFSSSKPLTPGGLEVWVDLPAPGAPR